MTSLVENMDEIKKRGYSVISKNDESMEISKRGKVILRCSLFADKGKDINESPGVIDIPDDDIIFFKKLHRIYLSTNNTVCLTFEDRRARKKTLKEVAGERTKWVIEVAET